MSTESLYASIAFKYANGISINAIEHEMALKDPNSIAYKRLAFILMCETFMLAQEKQRIEHLKFLQLSKSALEAEYQQQKSKPQLLPEDEMAVEALSEDVKDEEQLVKTNDVHTGVIKSHVTKLANLYQAEAQINQKIEQLEAEQRKVVNHLIDHAVGFTDEERQLYRLTPEKQFKIHQQYAQTEENIRYLRKTVEGNENIPESESQFKFRDGNTPEFELKVINTLVNPDNANGENVFAAAPSTVKTFSQNPAIFQSILSPEQAIYQQSLQQRKIMAAITRLEGSISDTRKAIEGNNKIFEIFDNQRFFQFENPSVFLNNLQMLYVCSGNGVQQKERFDKNTQAIFEFRLTRKLRALPEEEQEKVYAVSKKMTENASTFNDQDNDIFFILNNIFEENCSSRNTGMMRSTG